MKENRELLARAAAKTRTYVALARALGRTKGALSQWKEAGDIPDHTRRLLALFVDHGIPLTGDPRVVPSRPAEENVELTLRRRLAKVQAQLTRLAWQTRALGEKWEAIERLLDAWVPLTPREVEQAVSGEPHDETG